MCWSFVRRCSLCTSRSRWAWRPPWSALRCPASGQGYTCYKVVEVGRLFCILEEVPLDLVWRKISVYNFLHVSKNGSLILICTYVYLETSQVTGFEFPLGNTHCHCIGPFLSNHHTTASKFNQFGLKYLVPLEIGQLTDISEWSKNQQNLYRIDWFHSVRFTKIQHENVWQLLRQNKRKTLCQEVKESQCPSLGWQVV